ncbi:energy-coupling factor ABC transporter ATP-binding protein [Fredinandcohnia quinoae]|uniref:Energy-coupling factor transporter ATP-binding protein EcfA2 n=1 Tax=Fredinandcohnia quinoae TaxID=2918902 RepID=A0AAW5E149_9BACI|nr:energy-coupling factor ABC transporter ATP-binding protein [Fredinandcohnia sp. SECRCQ15]MCH1626053.1 energy-coupling factor ABC transporter ATP-binding protein [Fredinandcohnia sp. SECRCQ15]
MDITIENLEHRYQVHSPFERLALYDVNTVIQSGSYVAVIGHTGSGKSTILQHLNGLLKPTAGSITIGDRTISANKKEKNLKTLRKKVGVVFQFPEHQLFEETVEKDICFGPINFGVSTEEAKKKARHAIQMVGLSEDFLEKSPFDLSGGQMRRVAIAGILAMEPEVLVLDEPTAGLDPRGRSEIMEMFYKLHQEQKLTTILVTHSMEDAARYADQILVMEKGTIKLQGSAEEVFSNSERLNQMGLDVPEVVKFKRLLEQRLGIEIPLSGLSIDEIINHVGQVFNRRGAGV